MASFDLAIEPLLEREGGLTWNPVDKGGITNWGITLPILREVGELGDVDGDNDIDPDDIRKLPRERAIEVYRLIWWDRYGYATFQDQDVARKTLDLAVNFGATQGHKIAQRACRAVSFPIWDDGILGPVSKAVLRRLVNAQASAWVVSARSEAAGVYRQIIARHPTQMAFQVGWLRRAYDEW